MYDFRRCKLCGQTAAKPRYRLKQMTLHVCADCGFHFIDALDEFPEDLTDGSPLTAAASRYIESRLPQNARQLARALEFVHAHTALAGRQCLDIGAGAGQFPAMLREAGAVAYGVEPQQVFRDFAREQFQVDLRRERIEDPYWREGFAGHFDVVTLWDTLEHVNFPAETLQAASEVLKPGGFLFLDTPSRSAWFYRASEWSYRLSRGRSPMLLNSLYSPRPYRHKQIFTADQLENLLRRCGLAPARRSFSQRSGNKLVVAARKGQAGT
ncbi:MAG TPA: class I SAM-dependent methyltransferase [Desulfuromonadales bacterium]|nr:class I SAM-dependent methyltransferase [Desulfuromonadales bacterium]